MKEFKYQLVLQLPGSTQRDFHLLTQLEDLLRKPLEDAAHEVDGHDFGSGTMNIFIHTNDPKAAFAIVKEIVHVTDFPMLKAAYRLFDEDDYHLIWPEMSEEEFELS